MICESWLQDRSNTCIWHPVCAHVYMHPLRLHSLLRRPWLLKRTPSPLLRIERGAQPTNKYCGTSRAFAMVPSTQQVLPAEATEAQMQEAANKRPPPPSTKTTPVKSLATVKKARQAIDGWGCAYVCSSYTDVCDHQIVNAHVRTGLLWKRHCTEILPYVILTFQSLTLTSNIHMARIFCFLTANGMLSHTEPLVLRMLLLSFA